MALRYDIHRPSVITPEDYQYVSQECMKIEGLGDIEIVMRERARLQCHMEKTGGKFSDHEHGGSCYICGSAFAIYTITFYHPKSNTYLRVGSECAKKLEFDDGGLFRSQIHSALQHQAGKAKAAVILADKGLDAAYAAYAGKVDKWEENTIRDIVGKLVQYGNLSDKQYAFLGNLLTKIETRAERDAAQKAEHDAADVLPPTGDRIEITGVIMSRKSQEFGPDRLLVKSDAGWKVFGNIPSALCECGVGHRVSFFARVSPSEKDPKFGYYQRPTKAKRIG